MSTRREKIVKKKRNKKLKRFFGWALFSLVFAGSLYLLFFSGIFEIQKVAFSGGKTIQEEDLESSTQDFFNRDFLSIKKNKNFIFFSEKNFEVFLKEKFADIEKLEIKKEWPPALEVTVFEREPFMVFCLSEFPEEQDQNQDEEEAQQDETQDQREIISFWKNLQSGNCYFLDKNGVAFRPTSLILGSRFANVYILGDELGLGQKVIRAEQLLAIEDIRRGLDGMNVSAQKVFWEKNSQELRILTSQDWTIFFDVKDDISSQLTVLRRSLDEEIKDITGQLEYVDLRVAGRAYYKTK